MKRKLGFRTKLVVSILVLTGFLTSTVIFYRSGYRMTVESTEEAAQRTSDLIYNKISNYFSELIRVSQTMANDQLLIAYLEEGTQQAEKESTIASYLNAYKEEYQYDTVFLALCKDALYYTADGFDRALNSEKEEDNWYEAVLESDENYLLSIDMDKADEAQGAMTVFVDYKIKGSDGSVLGVIGVGVRLNSVQSMLEEISIDADGMEALLVDEDGKILISKSFEKAAESESAEKEQEKETLEERIADTEQAENFFEGEESQKMKEPIANLKGTEETAQLWAHNTESDDENYVVARYVPELSWYLIIRRTTEAPIEQIKMQILENLAVTGVIIAAIICIITYVVGKYEKKVTELTKELAEKDEMTGCYTKVATGRHFDRELSLNPQKKYAFFILDIDNFKQANDKNGHAFGDYAIETFSKTLRRYFGEETLLGRIGGDEFTALVQVADREEAWQRAKEVSEALRQECVMAEKSWQMSASIGMALAPEDGTTFDELYRNADTALYETKRNGKDSYAVFEQNGKKEE